MQVRIFIRDVSGKKYKSAWMNASVSEYDTAVRLFTNFKEMNNFSISIRNKAVHFNPINIATATIIKKDN
jgi:hypothetical protein